MRRAGQLFERVCAFDNLLLAARRAQRGKRYRCDVLRFNLRLEDNLLRLQHDLLEGRYRPQGHRHFVVREPKVRCNRPADHICS